MKNENNINAHSQMTYLAQDHIGIHITITNGSLVIDPEIKIRVIVPHDKSWLAQVLYAVQSSKPRR